MYNNTSDDHFNQFQLEKRLKYLGLNHYCDSKIRNPSMKIFYPDPCNDNDCAQCGKPKQDHDQVDGRAFFCDKDRILPNPNKDQIETWLRNKFDIYIW